MELEQQIQKRIIKRLEENGYFTLKLIKCNKNGYPDLLAIKNNETIFIEVKRPNGKLSELQKIRIRQLREQGITVKVWQDYECDFCTKS
jgi:Holliday junction resolvase